jgi:photosystem II stability/assembly factor-like uncharacterized protein
LAAAALAASAAPAAAQRWQKQYLHDDPKTRLRLVDLQFASPQRGIAVGATMERTGSPKPAAVVTSDGGAHWQLITLKELPKSVFFLNDSIGWLVTEKGLWRTLEAGKDWTKLPNPPATINRVHFLDEKNGWAACDRKTVLSTTDGGEHWSKLAEPSKLPGDASSTSFSLVVFRGGAEGMVVGRNAPPRVRMLPDWLEPELAVRVRETPHLSMMLQTADGGKTWKSDGASMFGEITRVRLAPGGTVLLVSHSSSFQYPSEVLVVRGKPSRSEVAFRDRKSVVTDIWVDPNGALYLAGTTANSRLRGVVPEKVRVMRSLDLKTWTSLDVDYRAVANSVILAGSGSDMWMATDRGMIMKLVP